MVSATDVVNIVLKTDGAAVMEGGFGVLPKQYIQVYIYIYSTQEEIILVAHLIVSAISMAE